MMRNSRWLVLALAFATGAASAGARDRLNAFAKDLKGLEGQFVQTVYDANGSLKERSSGHVSLSAPRLFRWEYVSPYPQLIVADGKKVWVFDPDLEQVTVRGQGAEEQNSPLAALIDPARLDRDFQVREVDTREGIEWLSLAPKQSDQAAFQSARLGFDATGLVRMEILDALGQRTEIGFSAWKKNPAFGKGTFRYVPPKGVDIVGES